MVETQHEWKNSNVCPNCGGTNPIKEGRAGKCTWCLADLVVKDSKLTLQPSDLPAGDFSVSPEAQKGSLKELSEIARQIYPPEEVLDNPKEYFKDKAREWEHIDDPQSLSQMIDLAFESAQMKFLESLEKFVENAESTGFNSPEHLQKMYETYMRLTKWLVSQRGIIEKKMIKAMLNMKIVSIPHLGGGIEQREPRTQLEQGYDPEHEVRKLLQDTRKTMISALNERVLWAGGLGSGEWERRKNSEFHPRFLTYLRDHLSELPPINFDEIQTLVTEFLNDQLVANRAPDRKISTAAERITDQQKGKVIESDDPVMTKADRLLELLFDEEVFPFVDQIFEKRKQNPSGEPLPEETEYKKYRSEEAKYGERPGAKFWDNSGQERNRRQIPSLSGLFRKWFGG